MLRIFLLIGLLISLIHTTSLAETTNNLVSQDFTTGWTGSNLNSKHSNTTIAGVNGQYIQSDSVSLNDSGINKGSINQGFTVTGSAEYWFWSGYNASVTQTIKTVDDNGNTLTQTRVVTGTSGNYNTLSDQLIIGSNTQQDYNISLRYDFADTSGYNTHYSADLKNPTLTINYTYKADLDSATESNLITLSEKIDATLLTEDFKKDLGVNYVNSVTGETYGTEPPTTNETTIVDTKEQTQENTLIEQSQDGQDSTSATDTSTKEETQTQSSTVQTKESQKKESVKTSQKTESQKETQLTSLSTKLLEFDGKIKNLDLALKQENNQKLNAMISNQVSLSYKVPFYKDKKIYTNQMNIIDDRLIYTNNLNSYIENDPIVKNDIELFNIRMKKQKLINELKVLKNGKT